MEGFLPSERVAPYLSGSWITVLRTGTLEIFHPYTLVQPGIDLLRWPVRCGESSKNVFMNPIPLKNYVFILGKMENVIFVWKKFDLGLRKCIFGGPFLLYKAKKKSSSKNSEKNLKNQEKYSKNNGENPSSKQWMVKKFLRSNCPKRAI